MPILLFVVVLAAWMADVRQTDSYGLRNILPLAVFALLALASLLRNQGGFLSPDARPFLGSLGFAVPAIGLTAYLHYAYAVNLNGMFSDSEQPGELFRFLPIYTSIAGLIGFAIGWIVGRSVNTQTNREGRS